MLSIVFLYFIGKPFYNLAREHATGKWIWAFLGIISFYAGAILFGIIAAIIIAVIAPNNYEEILNGPAFSLAIIPFGLVSCYLFYKWLKKRWENKTENVHTDILDEDFLNDV